MQLLEILSFVTVAIYHGHGQRLLTETFQSQGPLSPGQNGARVEELEGWKSRGAPQGNPGHLLCTP